MAFNFLREVINRLTGNTAQVSTEIVPDDELETLAESIWIREFAFWQCANLIAKAVAKCEFKTFVKGKETKGTEWYLFNIEPNKNQCSTEFLTQWITTLYRHNEALVIEQSGQLLVADSYNRKEYALYGDTFSDVTVKDFTFAKTFYRNEVLFVRLSRADMRKLTAGIFELYQKLISYSQKSYLKSRGTKGIIEVDQLAAQNTDFTKSYDELKNRDFKKFAESSNSVLPLFKGLSYTELGSKTYSSESTRDIRAQINDVVDFTALAFGIPPVLVNGTTQDVASATEQLLTFCVDPLTDFLSEEINRQRNGYAAIKEGTYLQIDTKAIKHIDLLSVSTAIDKLIASGAFCINDIRKTVGEPIIDEPWAWQHFMTKNYSIASDILKLLDSTGGA